MRKIEWKQEMEIKNIDRFKEELRLFFISKNFKATVYENGVSWVSPFSVVSPKYLLFLVDGGSISWEKKHSGKMEVSYFLSLKRAFLFFTPLPFFLVLSMFIYNYYTRPYFNPDWIKGLVLICAPVVGQIFLKMKEDKLIRFFEEITADYKNLK